MCGRFTLAATPAVLVDALLGIHPELVPPATAQPRCNIAPTQEHFIFAGRAERIAALPADWGLVNSWAADAKRAARQINARLETAAESRAYAPAFKRRRCAVPADGWYEWSGPADARRPHWIHRGDEAPFLLAGLWENGTPPGSDEQRATFTILTTSAASRLQPIHDRMPVVLPEDRIEEWLDPALTDAGQARRLLAGVNMDAFTARPVSTRVNYVRNDDAGLLREIDPATDAQLRALRLL